MKMIKSITSIFMLVFVCASAFSIPKKVITTQWQHCLLAERLITNLNNADKPKQLNPHLIKKARDNNILIEQTCQSLAPPPSNISSCKEGVFSFKNELIGLYNIAYTCQHKKACTEIYHRMFPETKYHVLFYIRKFHEHNCHGN